MKYRTVVAHLAANGVWGAASLEPGRTIAEHPIIRVTLSAEEWAAGKPPAREVTSLVESVQQIVAFYGGTDAEDK